MATIREMFHEIGNWHNKISVGSGVTRELLKQKIKSNASDEEIRDLFIKRLNQLEQHALGADKALNKLKGFIYDIIDPDTAKAKK